MAMLAMNGACGAASVNLTVMVVDLLDGLEQVAHVHALEVLVRAARNLVVGMVRVELALEA